MGHGDGRPVGADDGEAGEGDDVQADAEKVTGGTGERQHHRRSLERDSDRWRRQRLDQRCRWQRHHQRAGGYQTPSPVAQGKDCCPVCPGNDIFHTDDNIKDSSTAVTATTTSPTLSIDRHQDVELLPRKTWERASAKLEGRARRPRRSRSPALIRSGGDGSASQLPDPVLEAVALVLRSPAPRSSARQGRAHGRLPSRSHGMARPPEPPTLLLAVGEQLSTGDGVGKRLVGWSCGCPRAGSCSGRSRGIVFLHPLPPAKGRAGPFPIIGSSASASGLDGPRKGSCVSSSRD